jgi:hypothetical protein
VFIGPPKSNFNAAVELTREEIPGRDSSRESI